LLKKLGFVTWHGNCNQSSTRNLAENSVVEGESMSYNLVAKNWRELSEAASKEQDPQKLLELVTELNEVLKKREDQKRDASIGHPPQQ
jgi:hypothetical protein